MEKLSNETIDLILSDKFDENFWIFELGRTEVLLNRSSEIENQFISSFFEGGAHLWNKYKNIFVDYLCDKDKKEPKEIVQELISGDLRDFVTALLSVLTTTYSISLALAIPLCGLALKKGVSNICR